MTSSKIYFVNRKQVARQLNRPVSMLREATKTGYLDGVPAPAYNIMDGRAMYPITAVMEYQRLRAQFEQDWWSRKRTAERLGMSLLSLEYHLGKDLTYHGAPMPLFFKMNHQQGNRQFTHITEIQRHEYLREKFAREFV